MAQETPQVADLASQTLSGVAHLPLNETMATIQMIDEFSAKGVIMLMLMLSCGVCYFLMKRLFLEMDNFQKIQVEINRNIEGSISKIAESVSHSLEFLKEDIQDQKAHNALLQNKLEDNLAKTLTALKESELKIARIMKARGLKDDDDI